jgi:hypothetical protein
MPTWRRFPNRWSLTGTFSDLDEDKARPFEAGAFSLGLLWPFDPPAGLPHPEQ